MAYPSIFLTICSAIAMLFNLIPSKNDSSVDYLYQDLLRQGRIKAHKHNTNVSSKNCEECKLAEMNIHTTSHAPRRKLIRKKTIQLPTGKN